VLLCAEVVAKAEALVAKWKALVNSDGGGGGDVKERASSSSSGRSHKRKASDSGSGGSSSKRAQVQSPPSEPAEEEPLPVLTSLSNILRPARPTYFTSPTTLTIQAPTPLVSVDDDSGGGVGGVGGAGGGGGVPPTIPGEGDVTKYGDVTGGVLVNPVRGRAGGATWPRPVKRPRVTFPDDEQSMCAVKLFLREDEPAKVCHIAFFCCPRAGHPLLRRVAACVCRVCARRRCLRRVGRRALCASCQCLSVLSLRCRCRCRCRSRPRKLPRARPRQPSTWMVAERSERARGVHSAVRQR
jgi:hypothetical protein